jgi:hypothetical protein
VNKRPLQASAHYCEHKKHAVFGQTVNSHKDFKRLVKSCLIKTKAGAFLYGFLKWVIAFILKFLPCGGILHATYHSNNKLGIFITTSCNLKCVNCQAASSQAPADDVMTVEQVQKLVSEAVKLEYFWDRIYLTGGEPTFHPQLLEIIDVIKRYKDFNPECQIMLETNGAGDKVQSVLNKLPDWVTVFSSNKKEDENGQIFFTYNIAPCDTLEYMLFPCFSKGCIMPANCYGLCASMYGYYPCSPCMNVDRVFGFDVGIKKLDQVSEKALRKQMNILCRYCGMFRELTGKTVLTAKISRSWKRAFAKYGERKPKLSRYS